MTLKQLRYFLAAADLGSFTAAAEQMRVTQPAVAEQIRQLERHLGVELFARLGRGVRLTDAGAQFLDHARHVAAATDEAEASVAAVNDLRGGTITFGAFGAPAHYGFADLIEEFASSFPHVRLKLRGRNSSTTADEVRSGDLEAALVVLPINDGGLDVHPIVRDEVFYVSSDPERTRRPVTIEDVVSAPLILYETQYALGDPTRRQLAERAQRLGLRIEGQIEVEHIDTALQLVTRGLGDTYAPSAITRASWFPRDLYLCGFAPPLFDTFAIITRRGARISPSMRKLTKLVEQHMHAVAADLLDKGALVGQHAQDDA